MLISILTLKLKMKISSTIKDIASYESPAKTIRLLLKLTRAAQPVSRADLARLIGVNRSTVTDISSHLPNN